MTHELTGDWLFGFSMTAVLVVMLILNAVSY
jgi:hypothetical protein